MYAEIAFAQQTWLLKSQTCVRLFTHAKHQEKLQPASTFLVLGNNT